MLFIFYLLDRISYLIFLHSIQYLNLAFAIKTNSTYSPFSVILHRYSIKYFHLHSVWECVPLWIRIFIAFSNKIQRVAFYLLFQYSMFNMTTVNLMYITLSGVLATLNSSNIYLHFSCFVSFVKCSKIN